MAAGISTSKDGCSPGPTELGMAKVDRSEDSHVMAIRLLGGPRLSPVDGAEQQHAFIQVLHFQVGAPPWLVPVTQPVSGSARLMGWTAVSKT
jgi:hypothetical protein